MTYGMNSWAAKLGWIRAESSYFEIVTHLTEDGGAPKNHHYRQINIRLTEDGLRKLIKAGNQFLKEQKAASVEKLNESMQEINAATMSPQRDVTEADDEISRWLG